MDCIEFNKNIASYLDGRLEAAELNAFLKHMEGCKACTEELEINFIVQEGIRILDSDAKSYDLTAAFIEDTARNLKQLAFCKFIKRISYIICSLCFWAVLSSAVIFLRFIYLGI